MDPLLIALASFVQANAPFVIQKLIEKGVIEPGVKPLADKVQARATAGQKDDALVAAILTAIEDASGQEGESSAVQYAQKIRLHEIVEPGNDALCNEVMRLVYLASSADPGIVPDSLLNALRLDSSLRANLANFLFQLRRKLNKLPDFQPLFQAAHQQNVETALKQLTLNVATLTRTVERDALRVRVVADEWNAAPYLRYLANECNRLRLSAVDPEYFTLDGESRITLVQVYTDLEVTTQIDVLESERQKKTVRISEVDSVESHAAHQIRRMTVVEAITNDTEPQIVLLGGPGGGKTTFCNYLLYCLAKARLEPESNWLERLHGWTQGPLMPLRIILRDLATWADVESERKKNPTAQTLWEFIRHDLRSNGFEEAFEPLKAHMQTHGGLVVVDGLDEVPNAHQRRDFVKETTESFARANPLCRIVATCRPYAYRDLQWKLNSFSDYMLAPFTPNQINQFIERWHETVAPMQGWSLQRASQRARELKRATRQPHLNELAARPLLLTLMTTLHTSRGKLADDRADLYEECVALMLDYWQRHKDTRRDGQIKSEDGLLDVLGISRDQLERALAQVAFETHRHHGMQTDRKVETANITGDELRNALKPMLGNSLDHADIVIRYVQDRAGLLAEYGEDAYAFPHRTFREFLAACAILNSEDFPSNLAEWAYQDRHWWREVFLLAAGRSCKRNFGQAIALINALCEHEYRKHKRVNLKDVYAAILAAQAGAEIRLAERANTHRYKSTLTKLQKWLTGILTLSVLPTGDCAAVGRILSALGDPRSDVSCAIPETIFVPGGSFFMGNAQSRNSAEQPRHLVELAAYRIGKYPVTNAQYRHFVDAGGYTPRHQDCWTQQGWSWRTDNNITQPESWDDFGFNLDNHPVVGIASHEVIAYCNWLNKQNPGREFHLPTEAEWEKAARGSDEREYPWGNEFQNWANTFESKIQRTVAVGLFPKNISPFGALDMAGNVGEWCTSSYKTYPYDPNDGRESVELEFWASRIVRGGSWMYDRERARCAFREWNNPEVRSAGIGFRVAESISR